MSKRRISTNPTKIFLGWSGARSKELAKITATFIESLISGSAIFFSPSDIEKGSKWRGVVADELKHCNAGVWCLTRRSLKSAWIPFEAGAIAKSSGTRVCPLLFDFPSSKLPSPLNDFHVTKFEQQDVWLLMKDLIELANPNWKRDLEKSHSLFDRLWPALASEAAKILAAPSEDDSPIERIQGHWWSKLHVGPLDDGIGFVTISSDPTTDMPYLSGNHYYPDGSRGAEWKSKGACVIESQRDVIFFYYWEGSHRNENPVYVGSGEIRFSAPSGPIIGGDNFFTDTTLAEVPTSVIKKGTFRRATADEESVMSANDGRKLELIRRKLAESW